MKKTERQEAAIRIANYILDRGTLFQMNDGDFDDIFTPRENRPGPDETGRHRV